MKITFCGSVSFFTEMQNIQKQLENLGHQVQSLDLPDWEQQTEVTVERKSQAMKNHMKFIEWSDVILVVNQEKRGIQGYIGMNTLIEMGVAFYLKKQIYLLNDVPDVNYAEEIRGMMPTVIHGDLSKIV